MNIFEKMGLMLMMACFSVGLSDNLSLAFFIPSSILFFFGKYIADVVDAFRKV